MAGRKAGWLVNYLDGLMGRFIASRPNGWLYCGLEIQIRGTSSRLHGWLNLWLAR